MHRHSVAPSTGAASPPTDDPTRRRLLRAAVGLFDRKGYSAASVREIVERAGVTKPVLYYHFGSKEGLLLAVLDQAAERFTTTIARALERPGPTRERLLALGADLYDLLQEHLPAVRVAHVLLLSPPAAAPAFDFSVFHRTLHAALRQIVQEEFAGATLPAAFPEDAAIALSGVIGACASRQFHPGLAPIGPADLRRVLQMVFDGLLVSRPTAGASPQ
jgi:AcrR family transcriptional regulator